MDKDAIYQLLPLFLVILHQRVFFMNMISTKHFGIVKDFGLRSLSKLSIICKLHFFPSIKPFFSPFGRLHPGKNRMHGPIVFVPMM